MTNRLRWMLASGIISLIPMVLAILLVVVPSVMRGDFNPLIQVVSVICLVGLWFAFVNIRRIILEAQGKVTTKLVRPPTRLLIRIPITVAACLVIGILLAIEMVIVLGMARR